MPVIWINQLVPPSPSSHQTWYPPVLLVDVTHQTIDMFTINPNVGLAAKHLSQVWDTTFLEMI
jgi:hypothetical protein